MAPVSSSTRASTKPYNRPSSSKTTLTPNGVNLGAPSQKSQTSRKGKKAWRKHVDVTAEEGAMEAAREEERVTGGKIVNQNNNQLFTIDTTGDVEVAKKLRRTPKPLRSLANLSARSAVPSLTSRPTTSTTRRLKLTSLEKARLRRIARKTLDSVPSADIHTTSTPIIDAWVNPTTISLPGNYGNESVIRLQPRIPKTIQRQREVYINNQVEGGRGVIVVEGGSSYNPSAESHAELMARALREEGERLEREKADEERARLGEDIMAARRSAIKSEYADGMTVGPGEQEDGVDEDVMDDTAGPSSKKQRRKTQAQRNKALRRHEAEQLLKLEQSDKKLMKSLPSLKGIEAVIAKREKEQKEGERLADLAKRERERIGLIGGEKIGKHRVKKGVVDVQLGEDLAETLRQIKPEGNLFKDRFLALQKKALLEPRVPQLPKKKTTKTMTYEKHPYKRFK